MTSYARGGSLLIVLVALVVLVSLVQGFELIKLVWGLDPRGRSLCAFDLVWVVELIETCATIFWERAEEETLWETFVYSVGNSNMGTVLNSSSSSGIGAIIYPSKHIYAREPKD